MTTEQASGREGGRKAFLPGWGLCMKGMTNAGSCRARAVLFFYASVQGKAGGFYCISWRLHGILLLGNYMQ